MNVGNGPIDDRDVVFIDETNSVTLGPGPASEAMRKVLRAIHEKERKYLELRRQMNEKPEEGKAEDNGEADKRQEDKGPPDDGQTGKQS